MSIRGQTLGHTGSCNNSLTTKNVPFLRDACDKLGLKISPTGFLDRPIKDDYIAALWVNSMDFTSFLDETQDEIRRFISWLIPQKMPELHELARLHFQVEGGFRKKGEICQRILEQLLEDPELPSIPGFQSGDDINGESQQVTPDKLAQGSLNSEVKNQKMADVMSWICNNAPAEDQHRLLAAVVAENNPTASSQVATTKKPNKPKLSVDKKNYTANFLGGKLPKDQDSKTSIKDITKSIRNIAAAIQRDPASAILLVPALEKVADDLEN